MNPDHVAAHVRERSGLDVQAVTLVRSGTGDVLMPAVWAAMTEVGHFWAVEDGETIELFRAVGRRTAANDLTSCHSAVEAVRRFLTLHPPEQHALASRKSAPDGSPVASVDDRQAEHGQLTEDGSQTCQSCGVAFVRRPQASHAGPGGSTRSLCSRCRHAERERLRYQQDPNYRARRLAYSAARYRRGQQATPHDN
jgi:hypothetical protein